MSREAGGAESSEQVSMKDLCNGKQDEKFKLECWDEDPATKDDMIGWVETTYKELAEKKTVGLNDRPGGSTKEPGSIAVDRIHIIRYPTLYDYISNGCELTVSVAIDFTMSNGDPADPSSLHYIQPDGSLNQYEQAMIGVGEILVEYDHDKKIAVYGFGGIVAGHSEASHCFPLNGNIKDPEVLGVDGTLERREGTGAVLDTFMQDFSRLTAAPSPPPSSTDPPTSPPSSSRLSCMPESARSRRTTCS